MSKLSDPSVKGSIEAFQERPVRDMRRISIFGLGRVGLVMATSFAKHGLKVIGIDPNPRVIEMLQRGEPPFYEPKLREYLDHALKKRTLVVTQDSTLNSSSDLAYIAVSTPSRADGGIDLSYVEKAAGMIGQSLRGAAKYQLVVIKSTVTPGTARNVVKATIQRESQKTPEIDFSVCSNPEFLREGNAIYDTEFPDRIVIGSDDLAAIRRLERFYKKFHGPKLPPVIRTDFENAELTKYANNAFLATKVSFINCIANIAELVPHADVKAVAAGIGLDKRIGPQFLSAGLGWGGSCFPKDLEAIISFSRGLGYGADLIRTTVETNKKQAEKAAQFAKHFLGSLGGKHIAVLGLAFKPETDDMRDAVSVPIINNLLDEKATVAVWDPEAMENARQIFGNNVRYATGSSDCLEQADCCILVTEWPEFKKIRPQVYIKRMRQPFVIDGRRFLDVAIFRAAGVRVRAIGLGPES